VQSLVRLQEGVTREQANAALKTLAQRLTDRLNVPDRPIGLDLSPLVWRNETIRDIHKAMLGAALAVLLIACVNLAHLMLARGLSKRRELALRMALGATRAAVVRHMFAECLLITAAGLLVGGLVTVWCDDILSNRMPRSIAWILVQPRMSWRVFGVAGCTVAASAILFGLVPAIRVALDLNLDEPLKDNAGTTTGRVRQRYSTLVVAEVALALVLMMGGGLMLRTVMKLQRERFNFDPRKLYRANVTPPRGGPGQTTLARRHEVLGAARAVEGVQDAAIITRKVAPGGMVSAELADDSNRTIVLNEYGMGMYPLVSPEYFRVLGLPVLQGRDFEPGDAAGSGVAIIDGLAAQRLYPNQDPVGRMLKLGSPSSAHAPWVPIVGVVRSPYVLRVEGRFAPPPSLFVARAESLGYGELVMRTTTPDPSVATRVMRRLMSLPGVRQVSVGPYDYARQRELEQTGFLAKVFVTLGSVALGLAVLGLYGVLSYAVTRRMREFAVRLALGAEPRGLLRMVLHDGTVMVLGGIGLGAFIALASTRWLDAVLVSVLPSDVVSLLLAEAVLLSVGLAAALGPARRAARANPLDILRAT
jgi:putative ABC transport system permease protein